MTVIIAWNRFRLTIRFPFKQKNDVLAMVGVKKAKNILIQGQSQLWIPPPGT
jgi:hypothetical protein